MIRILHIIRENTNYEGIYTFLTKIKEATKDKGIEHYFIAKNISSGYIKNDFYENEYKTILLMDDKVHEYIDKIEPHILHFHDGEACVELIGRYEDYLNRFACVFSVHSTVDFCPQFMNPCLNSLSRKCVDSGCIDETMFQKCIQNIDTYRKMDIVTCLSPSVKEILLEQDFPPEKIIVLPPMIELAKEYQKRDRNIILFAGRVAYEKGIETLLKSLTYIMDADWDLYIAGTGLPKYMRKLIMYIKDRGLSERVHFLGHLSRSELTEHYKIAKIFVFPSICRETYGYAGADAVNYGVPVIGFDCNKGSPWIIDRYNGYIVPRNDEKGFSEYILKMIEDNDLYMSLRNNSLLLAKDLFENDQNEQINQLYQELIKKKGL